MPVATWGYGTGATGTGTHPFSLSIQGPDFISWVPIESIRVDTSTESNATLEFDIVEPSAMGTAPFTPFAFADVSLTDNTNAELVFSGVVVGVEEIALGVGVGRRVRAVDYGYLLDVCPMKRGVMVGVSSGTPAAGDFNTYLYEPILATMGQAASGPITAARTNITWSTWNPSEDGRVLYRAEHGIYDDVVGYVPDDAGTGDAINAGNLRSNLDTITARSRLGRVSSKTLDTYEVSPVVTYVDPERRLNVHPVDWGWGSAPFAIDNNSGTAVHTLALTVERDYTGLASGVFVSDSNTSSGGDNSAFYVSDTTKTNGYFVCPDATDAPLASAANVPDAGGRYLSSVGYEVYRGQFAVISTSQLRIGTKLTITDARFAMSNTIVVIQAVSTQFLPGSSGARQMTVDFIPRGTSTTRRARSAQRAVRTGISKATVAWTVP